MYKQTAGWEDVVYQVTALVTSTTVDISPEIILKMFFDRVKKKLTQWKKAVSSVDVLNIINHVLLSSFLLRCEVVGGGFAVFIHFLIYYCFLVFVYFMYSFILVFMPDLVFISTVITATNKEGYDNLF